MYLKRGHIMRILVHASISLTVAVVAWAALCHWATTVSAAEPRRVLIVHALLTTDLPWSDMAGSFRNELIKDSKEPIDLYEVSLTQRAFKTPKTKLHLWNISGHFLPIASLI